MSNSQNPIVGIGTKLPAGTVVAIRERDVLIDTPEGRKAFTFSQVEDFVKAEISQ